MVRIPLTIPNILSLYRILAFPFILYTIISHQESLFAWLLCINLVTDILDGMLARLLKQVTDIGARLDSLADNGTYIMAFTGLFMFKSDEMQSVLPFLWSLLSMFLFTEILSLIKFGKFPSFHLYSWKIGGYIQGTFFFVLFAFGFYPAFFWFMWTWSILSFIEHITIQLMIPELISNAKGLYWVLRDRNK